MSARIARPIGLIALMVLLFTGGAAQAASVPGAVPGDGVRASPAQAGNVLHPRPFYIFAHNPNQFAEAKEALANGANALEPDVMYFDCPTRTGLYMYHDNVCLATRIPDTVVSYLDSLHTLVKGGANLALIAFDIKSAAATRLKSHVSELQDLVATHLNYDGVNVNIFYSVANKDDSNGFFDKLCLKPREGIMIDGQNDPVDILNHLIGQITAANKVCPGPVPYNMGFGNGSFGESYGFAPNVILSMDDAAWLRASQPGSFAVTYAYPIVGVRASEYITAGVDGLIPDYDEQPQDWSDTVASIKHLHDTVLPARTDVVRLATSVDNPFQPRKASYGLRVDTRDVSDAGTDANIIFKLTGSCGSAEVSINGSYSSRFERDHRDFVTLPSKNLGILKSIELRSDGTGLGPDWNPGSIQISSDRWGIPFADNHTVDFSSSTIKGGTPESRSIAGWGRECDLTPPTAAPTQSPAKNGKGWNNTDVMVSWNWTDNVGGSGIDPDACTTSSTSTGEGNAITLTATCADRDENVGTATYTVKVDKTPPVVLVPANIIVNATGPAGAVVPFTVTATDALTAAPSITCSITGGTTVVSSGATFPIGTTTVSCTAKDDADNISAAKSFTVKVKSAAEQLADLLVAVTGMGPGKSLQTKVEQAQSAVASGDTAAACGTLSDFINEVAAQSGKKITKPNADSWITDARRIKAVLACA